MILKVNKYFQEKLNINNYKDYFEKIYFIKFEVKIKRNAKKFINLPEEKKQYYHIYYNNSNIETKDNFLNTYDDELIKVKLDYPVTSLQNLFNSEKIKSIY